MSAHGSKKHDLPRDQLKLLSHEARLEETGPSREVSNLIMLIVTLLFALLVWSDFVEIKTSATTLGTVIPSGDKRVVQHLEGGIVQSILVKDGDLVRKGQPLLQFEPTLRTAELNQIRAREAALSIKLIRLRAFINVTEPDYGALEKSYPELVEQSRFTLNGARVRIEGEKTVLQSHVNQQMKSVKNYKNRIVSLVEQSKYLKEALDMTAGLYDTGLSSRQDLITAKLDLAKNAGSITEARALKEEAEASIVETQKEILEIDLRERAQALEELDSVSGQLAEVRETIARLEDKVTRLEITSPVNGVVHGSKVNTSGAVVQPAELIMEIIPADEQVVIENKIQPSDIGHVEIGQETTVTITGFDARRYGTMKGELIRISPTTFLDEENIPYFKGHILLADEYLQSKNTKYKVVPGMTVQANIITGELTLLEYLTNPIYASLLNAFSER